MIDIDTEMFVAGVLLITLGVKLFPSDATIAMLGIVAGGWAIYRSFTPIMPDGV